MCRANNKVNQILHHFNGKIGFHALKSMETAEQIFRDEINKTKKNGDNMNAIELFQ